MVNKRLALLIAGASSVVIAGALRTGGTTPIRNGWVEVVDSPVIELPAGDPINGRAESSKGEPTLINFWASYCTPCKAELPILNAYAAQSSTAAVIGVTRDRYLKYSRRTIEQTATLFPNWQDWLGEYSVQFDDFIPMTMIPSTVLVMDGKVRAVHVGPFESVDAIAAGVDEFSQ